jgi:hypothetical protein
VSNSPPAKAQPKRGKRHPLLYQQRLSEQYFWPAVLTVSLSAALLIWGPAKLAPYRFFLTVAASSCGLVLVLTLVYRLRAYAVCSVHGLRVQLPFYRFEISYEEIKAVRPTELFRLFPPSKQRWPQRRFLTPLFGTTVLSLELEQLPHRTAWLRLWMSKYMLAPDRVGLVLAVRDWLSFRAELDEYSARYRKSRI